MWEEAAEGIGKQASRAAVAFAWRPFPTAGPGAAGANHHHHQISNNSTSSNFAEDLLNTLTHHGLFGPGYRCAGRFSPTPCFFWFSPAFSVTQLKVTGWKLLGSTSTLLRPNKRNKKSSAKSNCPPFWHWFDIIFLRMISIMWYLVLNSSELLVNFFSLLFKVLITFPIDKKYD